MKKILISASLLFLSICVFAQAQESSTPHLKKELRSAKISLPYSPEVVVAALNNFISKEGKAEQKKVPGYLLSENTLLYKNNIDGFDMHFFYGLLDPTNLNESVLYLNLESSMQNADGKTELNRFDIQQAKDYLDNFAIAIQPYATALQFKLQSKNLAYAITENEQLIKEGSALNEKGEALQKQINTVSSSSKNDRLIKRQKENKRAIDDNLIAQAYQNYQIDKQKVALALLGKTQLNSELTKPGSILD